MFALAAFTSNYTQTRTKKLYAEGLLDLPLNNSSHAPIGMSHFGLLGNGYGREIRYAHSLRGFRTHDVRPDCL